MFKDKPDDKTVSTIYEITEGLTAAAEQMLKPGAGTVEGHEAEYAIDNDTGTYWESGTGARWIRLDLGKIYDVKKINILCISDGTRYYHYDIQASNNAIVWTTIASKTDNTAEPAGGITYKVDARTRYLRVYVYYNSADNNVQVSEIRVFGCDCPCDTETNPSVSAKSTSVTSYTKNINSIIRAQDCDFNSGFTFTKDIGEEISLNGDYGAGKATEISSAREGNYLKFSNVDFGDEGADQFRLRVRIDVVNEKSLIEIRLDNINGTKIVSMPIYRQWHRRVYDTMACDITNTTGIHDVFIIVKEAGENGFGINWIQFVKKRPMPEALRKPEVLQKPEAMQKSEISTLPDGADFNVYFGNLHAHSGMSDGLFMPDRAFDYVKNNTRLDFYGLTDHTNLFDNQFDWDKSRKWAELKALASAKTINKEFVALEGYEMTWYNDIGHINIFNTEFFDTAGNMRFDKVTDYYDHIKQYPEAIVMWNHPWAKNHESVNIPYDEQLDKVVHLVEARSIPNDPKFYANYIDVLDKGWHVAPSGNHDNHKANWGTESGTRYRTAILAEKLDREHILNAIRNHRVYTTTDSNMRVIYRINNQIMGSVLPNPSDLAFDIKAWDTDEGDNIIKIEIITEGGETVYSHECDSTTVHVTANLPNDKKYYWVKVIQADGECAFTAPIWTGR